MEGYGWSISLAIASHCLTVIACKGYMSTSHWAISPCLFCIQWLALSRLDAIIPGQGFPQLVKNTHLSVQILMASGSDSGTWSRQHQVHGHCQVPSSAHAWPCIAIREYKWYLDAEVELSDFCGICLATNLFLHFQGQRFESGFLWYWTCFGLHFLCIQSHFALSNQDLLFIVNCHRHLVTGTSLGRAGETSNSLPDCLTAVAAALNSWPQVFW